MNTSLNTHIKIKDRKDPKKIIFREIKKERMKKI